MVSNNIISVTNEIVGVFNAIFNIATLKMWIYGLSSFLSITVNLSALYLLYINVFSEKLVVRRMVTGHSSMNGETRGVFLENRNLRSVYLKSLYLVVDNKYIIKIFKDDTSQSQPIVVTPFSIENVESVPYSYRDLNHVREELINEAINMGKFHFLLETANGKTQIRYIRKNKEYKADKNFNARNNRDKVITEFIYKYNNITLQPNFRYICYLYAKLDDGKLKLEDTLVITSTGLILNGDILGYNGLPEDFTANKESLKCYIQEFIDEVTEVEKNNILVHVEDLREQYEFID